MIRFESGPNSEYAFTERNTIQTFPNLQDIRFVSASDGGFFSIDSTEMNLWQRLLQGAFRCEVITEFQADSRESGVRNE